MHVNESRICAVMLFLGLLKCLVQIVFVNIGDTLVTTDCFADESKI